MKTIKTILTSIIYIVIFSIITYLRFSNPELTETQLLLEYWHIWAVIIIVLIGSLYLPLRK